jgi:deazaflavin-dependent oxidoreductase (nitroreductase family)
VVILTSLGAKSGLVRKNPVMRIVDGDRYVAVASAGGSPTHPSWYANLLVHPLVRIQDGAQVREFLAREVTGNEKDYFWRAAPANLAYENALTIAEGDYVMLHGRFSNNGRPASWIAVNIVRMQNGLLAEHWDVLQDEATQAESLSGRTMFGDRFPASGKS